MRSVGANDFYEVRPSSLFSSLDHLSLTDLYLPLIGPFAHSIYLALLQDKTASLRGASTHEGLFNKLNLTPGQFERAMEALEAVGLVRTYLQESPNEKYFVYVIFAPLDPKQFFNDILFKGMLEKRIGPEESKRLMKKYQLPSLPEGMEEVSASFVTFFSPDFDDPVFMKKGLSDIGGHDAGKVKTSFDPSLFGKKLSELGIDASTLSKQEMSKIERLSALYYLSSEVIAELVVDCYQGYKGMGKRVDFSTLDNKCRESLSLPYLHQEEAKKSPVHGDGAWANMIRIMDKLTPIDFLKRLQKGHKPAQSDLKLVNHLAVDMGLPDPVINYLLFYVLQSNNQILSYAYTEKIAASLMRAGCKTSRDALDYLGNKKEKSKKKKIEEAEIKETSPQVEIKEEDEDEESLDDMLDALFKGVE